MCIKIKNSGNANSGNNNAGSGTNGGGQGSLKPTDAPVDIPAAAISAAIKKYASQLQGNIAAAKNSNNGWMSPNNMADSNDTYRYARMLNMHITSLTQAYRLTGDKHYVAEIDRLLERMKAKLKDYNHDGFRNWVYNHNRKDGVKWAGDDFHVMDDLMAHANVAGAAFTLRQAGYKDHADFWTNYLVKDFEAKWRKRNRRPTQMPFITKELTHPYIQSIRLYYYLGKLTGKNAYTEEALKRAKVLHSHFRPIKVQGKDGYVWSHFVGQPNKAVCVPNPYVVAYNVRAGGY